MNTAQLFSAKENRVLALAALFQAAQTVVDLAQSGESEPLAEQSLRNSLFIFDADDTLAIYAGELRNLQCGLTILSKLSDHQSNKAFTATARYALSLLSLEKQLAKNPDMLAVIYSRLKHLSFNQQHFNNDIKATNAGLSAIYQDTLSTLRFRIHVTGNMQLLTQTPISDRVRAMLFSGIRASMLWRQLGGTKWQLLFGRGSIETISQQLLQKITQSTH